MDTLKKIYVEPTTNCNLDCDICIRHNWDESLGFLEWPVFEALIDGLANFPDAETIAFSGLGEPLLHERLADMVRLAHARGLRTEMTSNAQILTPALAGELVRAGLDQFVVSIDGASEATYGATRGAALRDVLENVRLLGANGPSAARRPLRVGIEFVAMKRNIAELPELSRVARRVGASFILVTNVLPYTPGLRDQILYARCATSHVPEGAWFAPEWRLPKIDWSPETRGPLGEVLARQPNVGFLDFNLASRNNYCPFVNTGCLAVAWDGGLSPCPPLMHSYTCYVMNREKRVRRHVVGRLPGQSLRDVWELPSYKDFRRRVREFEFSPCVDCGCELAESNEGDCYGNPFPACGDCLWARGIIRCA